MKSRGVPSYAQALILAALIIVVVVITALSCSERKTGSPTEPTTPPPEPTTQPEPTTEPEPTTNQGGESTTTDSLPDTGGGNPTH